MKRIPNIRVSGQECWEHDGREYSIIDLRIMPVRPGQEKHVTQEMTERYRLTGEEVYGLAPYEVLELSSDSGLTYRFATWEEARQAIKKGLECEE